MRRIHSGRGLSLVCVAVLATLLGGAGSVLLGVCGPFTDVAADAFCPFVLEIFTLGITTGTTATTYDPTSSVTRLQMAAFLSRTVDGVLNRGSRRAALGQFWMPQSAGAVAVGTQSVPFSNPTLILSDGADVWVQAPTEIMRVRASDGAVLWTSFGLTGASGLLVAMGQVWFTAYIPLGQLVRIDPSQNSVSFGAIPLPSTARSLTFDGARIFAADETGGMTIVTVGGTIATVTTGFTQPYGTLFDGKNVWVTDLSAGTLSKLDSAGAVLQTVSVGPAPSFPAFDGANIWIPNSSFGANSVTVVRASSGAVLATLTGNGVQQPASAAFDGERILVTNQTADTVSLFKAADLTPLGSVPTGSGSWPYGACSDGINFWITLNHSNQLVRF
jgi:hypothetical protein